MSRMRRPVSSETRIPVWTASSSRAWSRRPVQRDLSGLASSASVSAAVRKHTRARSARWGRDGENASYQRRVLGVAQRSEAEERAHRGQPGVAAGDAGAPLVLEVVQEGADHRGVQVTEGELGGRRAGPVVHVDQQHPPAAPVGRDGVRAGVLLEHEPLGEERFEGRGEEAHRPSSKASSSPRAARPSSSGVADRYQTACPELLALAGERLEGDGKEQQR